jgi:hypothetical protein
LQAEVFVLAYTEELLAAQEQSLSGNLKTMEKQHGVAVSCHPLGYGTALHITTLSLEQHLLNTGQLLDFLEV